MTDLKNTILEMSRQNQTGVLSPWFNNKLEHDIKEEIFLNEDHLQYIGDKIVSDLVDYRRQTGVSTAVIGMSGGVDSALTAALLKKARWNVIGVTMPINQNPEETARGVEACAALGVEHKSIDLSRMFDNTVYEMKVLDDELVTSFTKDIKPVRIRLGNIRARLRMITLYNLAAKYDGLVASTDNYSELAVGFWTICGDVGDLSPIQSLTKSWEVPMLAKLFGVPEKTWRAKPTDGLGVDDGDEAQFGFTYLELDLMLLALGEIVSNGLIDDVLRGKGGYTRDNVLDTLNIITEGNVVDEHSKMVLNGLLDRMGSTWFKRFGAINIEHSLDPGRYNRLAQIDRDMFQPVVVKGAY